MLFHKTILQRPFTKCNVQSLQNKLTSSKFLENFFPQDYFDIMKLPKTSSTLPQLIQKYRAQNNDYDNSVNTHRLYQVYTENMPYDIECLERVLLEPVKNILNRPSKFIRAMMIYNFNKIAKIDNEETVLHLCAFIEILHSLTLIIGKINIR